MSSRKGKKLIETLELFSMPMVDRTRINKLQTVIFGLNIRENFLMLGVERIAL